MKKEAIIEGLKSLIEDRKSFLTDGDDEIFLEDIKVLKEAIKLILGVNVINFKLEDIGCPFCVGENLIFISSNDTHANYRCHNCNTRIKVKMIKEITEIETDITN